jgi:uncharacterized RDD family membrane protein YckC
MDLMSRPALAGIGARFGAVLLDGLLPSLISIPLAIAGYAALSSLTASPPSLPGESMQTFAIFILLLTCLGFMSYSALMLAMWSYGMTPGKWLLGLRVITVDTGLPAGFWRMVLREYIGRLAAGLFCAIGYFWALFDANKQGWHDKIAKTLVVRTR